MDNDGSWSTGKIVGVIFIVLFVLLLLFIGIGLLIYFLVIRPKPPVPAPIVLPTGINEVFAPNGPDIVGGGGVYIASGGGGDSSSGVVGLTLDPGMTGLFGSAGYTFKNAFYFQITGNTDLGTQGVWNVSFNLVGTPGTPGNIGMSGISGSIGSRMRLETRGSIGHTGDRTVYFPDTTMGNGVSFRINDGLVYPNGPSFALLLIKNGGLNILDDDARSNLNGTVSNLVVRKVG